MLHQLIKSVTIFSNFTIKIFPFQVKCTFAYLSNNPKIYVILFLLNINKVILSTENKCFIKMHSTNDDNMFSLYFFVKQKEDVLQK